MDWIKENIFYIITTLSAILSPIILTIINFKLDKKRIRMTEKSAYEAVFFQNKKETIKKIYETLSWINEPFSYYGVTIKEQNDIESLKIDVQTYFKKNEVAAIFEMISIVHNCILTVTLNLNYMITKESNRNIDLAITESTEKINVLIPKVKIELENIRFQDGVRK